MAKVVKPVNLISKVLTFVLAGAVVVLATLVVTLIKMAPLERPEIFFLRTPTRSPYIVIIPMNPNASNTKIMDYYLDGFVREYVIARNTLYPGLDAVATRENWANVVKPWSSDAVFSDFTKTSLYHEYAFNRMPPMIQCSVNFDNTNKRAVLDMHNGRYEVKFVWVCKNENIGGQTTQKNYKIQLRIESDLQGTVAGTLEDLEKLRQNPLGIQVTEYVVKEGHGDPLNSNVKSW